MPPFVVAMPSRPPASPTLALTRSALAERSGRHVHASGALSFVAAPSMAGVYVGTLTGVLR